MRLRLVPWMTLLLLLPLTVLGQDISQQTSRKKKIEEEIQFIDRQLADNRNQQSRQLSNINLTQKKIESRKALIQTLNEEIKSLNDQIRSHNQEIDRLQNKLDTLQFYYEDMLLKAYKNRDSRVWFMYLLSSKDLNQGYRRWAYLKSFKTTIRKEAESIRQTEAQIRSEKEKLSALRLKSEQSKKEQESAQELLRQEEKAAQANLKSLQKKEKTYRKQLQTKKKEVEKLNKEIERILAEAVKEQKTNEKKGIQIDAALSSQFSKNKGKLPWPVTRGVVVEKFGQHNHPAFKHIKLPFNNGVNISTDRDAEVYAIFDGVVKQVLVMPGYNQCVLVQHGEYFTFYCKLKRVTVKSGEKISIGTQIGQVDQGEEGPILHFQLWKGTEKQNPEHWLKKK